MRGGGGVRARCESAHGLAHHHCAHAVTVQRVLEDALLVAHPLEAARERVGLLLHVLLCGAQRLHLLLRLRARGAPRGVVCG